MTSENQTVGLGVYILSSIWLITLLLCIISVRTGQLIGAIAFVVSSIITLILILIPRVSNDIDTSETTKVYDRLFVLRYCSLALMLLGAFGGFAYFLVYNCMTPVETKKLRHWTQ